MYEPLPTLPSKLIETLSRSDSIVVLTGAGISAESGVPTFREAQTGLWARYEPTQLATPEAFRRNPALVWEWYQWRRQLISQVKPNRGHLALARMARFVPDFTLITQNVDGLHQEAGSQNVVELHGNIWRNLCVEEDALVASQTTDDRIPPHCPSCGGLLRPDVVWFGETLPRNALATALAAAQRCEVFFSIGTSAIVHPAAALAHEASNYGATVVEINLTVTPLSDHADFVLRGPAGQILPMVVSQAFGG
jgi:NAD-dependent deacetylase